MATKVKDGLYKSSVYLGKDAEGKRKQKVFYAPSADEADFLALEFKLKKKRCEDPLRITLEQAIDKYIADKDAILSPTTLQGYVNCKNNRFQGLMQTQLADIDSKILQKAINAEAKTITARGTQISPKTLKNATGLVIAVINYFFPDKRIKVKLPQIKPITYETPNGEQLQKIFEATRGTNIEIPVLLSAWLSLRPSEICGLKWSDIHDTYVDINEAKVYAFGEQHSKAPKTALSARRIPLPKYIKDILARQEQTSEYVVNITTHYINKRFKRILELNNLPHCRFYDLRHANASIMLQLNIPDKYAQERGGWATNGVMKKIYQQTFSDEQLRIANRIDDYFNSLIHT